MLTVYQKMHAELYERGLFENDATAIMEKVKADTSLASMTSRWNDSAEGYPPMIFATIWMVAKDEALKWIDANCPQHWARPLFVNEVLK